MCILFNSLLRGQVNRYTKSVTLATTDRLTIEQRDRLLPRNKLAVWFLLIPAIPLTGVDAPEWSRWFGIQTTKKRTEVECSFNYQ